jgi:FkbM family methyltransferase
MTIQEDQLQVLQSKSGKQFYVRPDSFDYGIVNEVVDSKSEMSYANLCTFNQDDVWFDIGGHIGTFSCRFAPFVKQIIAFEPDQDNAFLFRKNIELNGVANVQLHNVALIESSELTRTFYLNTKKLTAGHSFYAVRGRQAVTVQCRKLTDYVDEYHPNKIKLDTEGSEQKLFQELPDLYWSQFNQLVFEWHFLINRDKDHSQYEKVLEQMKRNFPFVKSRTTAKAWTTVVACAQEDIWTVK